ncbi:phage tail tube protein [Pararhizobium sp. BT-229]|uniref:phage tail tube protein n=1 Tax=Pararhizobium sp. BT-229 TaxID=2986923 RepID=UPI0021F7EB97|nr:phage tail tube protein [Pararhizobium sp. BT-229]MCV9960386.1 phage tail tube protein [Pararhizobium sp. BT-229]
MAYAENWNGYVAIKAQSAKGAQASGAGAILLPTSGGAGGQLSKTAVQSALVRHDAQQLRGRHGSRRTSGTYSSEIGIGRTDSVWEALMRSAWSAANLAITQAAMTSVTTGANTIVAAAGSWITEGLRVGDVIRATGLPDAANNGKNLRITGLTALTITVAETLVVNAVADTGFTITRPGRVLTNGAAGALTRTYFTIEEYMYDLDASELYTDCRWSRGMIRMNADGLLDTEFGWTGTGEMEVVNGVAAPHFTSPADPTEISIAASEAVIRMGSADVLDLTSFDFTMDLQPSAPTTVRPDKLSPDVFLGTFQASMNMTLLLKDLQALADFDAETQLSLHLLASENEASPSDFFSLVVPNFTLGSFAKSALTKAGGARTVTLSIPADLVGKDTRGGAFDPTTCKIQVSNAA